MCGDEINGFSFDLYNKSGNGLLDAHELKYVLSKIHGRDMHLEEKVQAAFELMSHKNPLYITKSEYMSKIKNMAMLVFPLFAIQDRLREVILGERYWKSIESKAIRYDCIVLIMFCCCTILHSIKQDPDVISLFESARLVDPYKTPVSRCFIFCIYA